MSKYRTNDVDRLAAMFKALSNPQRLRIFIRLATCCVVPDTVARGDPAPACGCGPESAVPKGKRRRDASVPMTLCCGELGADVDLAPSTVSHHLKELRQAGLMQVERHGRKIECWVGEDTLRLLESFFAPMKGVEHGGR